MWIIQEVGHISSSRASISMMVQVTYMMYEAQNSCVNISWKRNNMIQGVSQPCQIAA